jgi:hypothetical protein
MNDYDDDWDDDGDYEYPIIPWGESDPDDYDDRNISDDRGCD